MDADTEEMLEFLAEEGYRARDELDGEIRFKSEGVFVSLRVSRLEDAPILSTTMGIFLRYDDIPDAIERAHALTERLLVVKAGVLEPGVVCLLAEQFCTMDSFKLTFEIVLGGLHMAARAFAEPQQQKESGRSEPPSTAGGLLY